MHKTKQILGFGQYGSVLMFIERNHNKVTLTVGPYKNGHCLEHKIQIHPQQHNDCVILIDEVIELSDSHVIGLRKVEKTESWVKGHFPGAPVKTSATKNG